MKTRPWFLLIILSLLSGCAPGYYAPRSSQLDAASESQTAGMWFQNPETPAERDQRIWREESNR
jgi:hypothetical protein